MDSGATNHGTILGEVAFGTARVFNGFLLDGAGDGILLGNPSSLHLQDLTIEAWLKRASTNLASHGSYGIGAIFACGWGGYFFWMDASGFLHFNRLGDFSPLTGPAVTDTAFHHVAVTKSGSVVTFYLDGQPYPAPTYNGTFTFTTSIGIGIRPDDGDYSFLGTIDEVGIYSRGLSSIEVQAIYAAGSAGKCFTTVAPYFLTQPADQMVFVGEAATFEVTAAGTPPLAYQWRFNGTDLPGATGSVLTLLSAQPTNAGIYNVVVSNSVGTAVSSNALLAVLPAPNCLNAPTGIVAWWRGQGDTTDQVSGLPGISLGNVTLGEGKVGKAFVLDGSGDGVLLGNLPSLHLQNLTIEGWIRRASTESASNGSYGVGAIFACGTGGYFFWMDAAGFLHFNRYGDQTPLTGPAIADLAFHHIAVTKSGTAVTFYVDGQPYPAPTYNGTFTFNSSFAIGIFPENQDYSFLGAIDEVSVYNRALGADEIQALYEISEGGKCVTSFPPVLVTHPASQTASRGASVTFNVVAAGTPPLAYQWTWNGTNLPGATTSSLTLTNVQATQAGSYAVTVTNLAGSASSSAAQLSLVFPPAAVRLQPVSAMAGGPVSLPVEIVANGNESALQFSLSYNPTLLTYTGAALDTNLADATLFVNTNQLSSGRLGCILALPIGNTLQAGTQELVRVRFNTPIRTTPTSSSISFGDSPTLRQLVDTNAAILGATYSGAYLNLSASVLEGDVSPRPNGDKVITVSDWVMLGRYAARLDYPTNASEFQRADCAPRTTLGDGTIKVTDWVQVGRYAGAVDSLNLVGGPATEEPNPAGIPSAGGDVLDRLILVESCTLLGVRTGTVSVLLHGLGNECALGFSLLFDPGRLSLAEVAKGAAAANSTLNLNTSRIAEGKLGVALALSSGTFPRGTCEILKLAFSGAEVADPCASIVSFADSPVPREVSDDAALPLLSAYQSGTITMLPLPALKIGTSDGQLILAWPAWATNFALQASASLNSATWTNSAATPILANGEFRVTLPSDASLMFYRLYKP